MCIKNEIEASWEDNLAAAQFESDMEMLFDHLLDRYATGEISAEATERFFEIAGVDTSH